MSDLATRLRTACDQVRVKSYPLSDLIPLMQQAADALAAAPRQPAPSAAPAGFAIVPVDATEAMMAAFAKSAADDVDWNGATEVERQEVRDGFGPAYRAMLAAAPMPSHTPQADSQPALFREALAWGMTYGPEIPAHQWDEIRESMVKQFADRAARAPADSVGEDAARYRWLRNKSTVLHNTAWLGGATAFQRDVDFLRRDDALAALDATIDAARKQGATP